MFCVLFAVHSGLENLSYFAIGSTRLAPLAFLVSKCLIIQGGGRAALRSQPSVFHIFRLGLLGSRSLFLHHGRIDKDIVRFLNRTGCRQALPAVYGQRVPRRLYG